MSIEINLLGERKKGQFSKEQILLLTKIAAIASVIITVSLSLILFLLSRDPTLGQVDAEQATILTKLNLLHTKTAKDLILLDRTKKITTLLQTRSSFDKTISGVRQEIPSSVTVTAFSLDNKTFVLTLTSDSLAPVGQALDNFTKLAVSKKLVKTVTIQGLITDEKSGKYVLSLSGELL